MDSVPRTFSSTKYHQIATPSGASNDAILFILQVYYLNEKSSCSLMHLF